MTKTGPHYENWDQDRTALDDTFARDFLHDIVHHLMDVQA